MWTKKGRIFEASGQHGWMHSHAQVPTVWLKDADTLRIFFSTRPEPGLSMTTFIDVSAHDPSEVLYVHDRPILELGKAGAFDEHGIMPSCVVEIDKRLFLYYSGWSRCTDVPYRNFTGLAVSEDGATFTRVSEEPILKATVTEPHSATSPFMLIDQGQWRSWYCSGTAWRKVDGKLEHQYDLKVAQSDDGIAWRQPGLTALPCGHDSEALTRPTVIKENGAYHMWFCYRGMSDFRNGAEGYRIGYAYSHDLEQWTRDDTRAGIELSDSGWDSLMLAYPYVIRQDKRLLMFYNGNGFGAEGMGYAECSLEKR
jgi:hypothetical protein